MKRIFLANLLVILWLLLGSTKVFAADILITGKLLDQKGNPVGMGSVAFLQEGKTIAAATTDSNGAYSVMVSSGKYTIEASGPEGSKIDKTIITDQNMTQATTRDITLQATPIASVASSIPWVPIVIIAVVIVALIGFLILRRRNNLTTSI